MEQTLDKSPVLRESVMALFTEQKVDHENRPQISYLTLISFCNYIPIQSLIINLTVYKLF